MADLGVHIKDINTEARARARERADALLMPHRALGKLLDIGEKVAGIAGFPTPDLSRKMIVVMAGDHGVTEEGVSAYPSEVTGQMVHGFTVGVAGINVLSRHGGIEVRVVDMGCKADLSALVASGAVIDAKVGPGTANMRRVPAMTREQAVLCIKRGADIARRLAADGVRMIGTGDMGIGNTTPSAAIAAVTTGRKVSDLTGRGTGVDDAGLAKKTRVIQESIAARAPDARDALDILSKIGGFEIGGISRSHPGCGGSPRARRDRWRHLDGRRGAGVAGRPAGGGLHVRRPPLRGAGAPGNAVPARPFAHPRPGHAPGRRNGLRPGDAHHRGRRESDPGNGHLCRGGCERRMRRFFSALAFLTVIPVPDALKSRAVNGMFAGYPAAGLVIGALLSAAAAGAAWLFPPVVASAVLVGVSLLVTGAIHLDGLADCADAFYGRRDRETVLRILKDPRIGTMGGAAIGLSLLLRTASFLSIPTGVLVIALPAASMLSRGAVLAAMRLLPYARSEAGIISSGTAGKAGKAVSRTSGTGLVLLAVVSALVAAVFFPVPVGAALIALALFWRLSWKKIGGCTGDVLGAGIEIAEIVFFLALAAMTKAAPAWGLFPAVQRAVGVQ